MSEVESSMKEDGEEDGIRVGNGDGRRLGVRENEEGSRGGLWRSFVVSVVFGLIAVVAVGGIFFLCWRVNAVSVREVVLALVFGLYYIVSGVLLSSDSNRETFGSIAPNVILLRALILFSFVISFAIPGYILVTEKDEETRRIVGLPLFWFLCERLYELVTNRPTMALSIRLTVVLTSQIYRLTVIYDWFRASSDLNIWIQLLAAINLLYWSFAVFGYGFLYVFPTYFDTDAVKRELDERRTR